MYTIKDVSKIMNISEHTLRFWAKSGFFPFVKRDENNARQFSDTDLEWVKIVKCLRGIGVENKGVKKYIELCIEGDSTIKERLEIIKKTRIKAEEQLELLNEQMEILKYKENYYKNLLNGDKNDVWNPINKNLDTNCV